MDCLCQPLRTSPLHCWRPRMANYIWNRSRTRSIFHHLVHIRQRYDRRVTGRESGHLRFIIIPLRLGLLPTRRRPRFSSNRHRRRRVRTWSKWWSCTWNPHRSLASRPFGPHLCHQHRPYWNFWSCRCSLAHLAPATSRRKSTRAVWYQLAKPSSPRLFLALHVGVFFLGWLLISLSTNRVASAKVSVSFSTATMCTLTRPFEAGTIPLYQHGSPSAFL